MKALIVVDVQKDFVDGVLGSADAQAVMPNIKKIITEYLENGDQVYFTFDTHSEDNYFETLEGQKLPILHCVNHSDGWKIANGLRDINVENFAEQVGYIEKTTFGYSHWPLALNEDTYESITLVGLDTDICVVSNALILRAQFPNTPIYVIANCCAGTSQNAHNAALTVMRSCQIEVIE